MVQHVFTIRENWKCHVKDSRRLSQVRRLPETEISVRGKKFSFLWVGRDARVIQHSSGMYFLGFWVEDTVGLPTQDPRLVGLVYRFLFHLLNWTETAPTAGQYLSVPETANTPMTHWLISGWVGRMVLKTCWTARTGRPVFGRPLVRKLNLLLKLWIYLLLNSEAVNLQFLCALHLRKHKSEMFCGKDPGERVPPYAWGCWAGEYLNGYFAAE